VLPIFVLNVVRMRDMALFDINADYVAFFDCNEHFSTKNPYMPGTWLYRVVPWCALVRNQLCL